LEDILVLADIGNTNIHIWENGKMYNLKSPKTFEGDLYFISVNESKKNELLRKNPHAINLEKYVNFDTSYEGLGIDRIMACKTVEDGVVIDAGSAVTIDIMQNGIHLGGVIMPGIAALKETFGKISPKLDVELVLPKKGALPQNTKEAVGFGSLGAILLMINHLKKDKKVYLTGGDGQFLSRFVDGIFIKDLIFRGMIKTIKEDL
jgi:type III pantothenate kinase